MYVLRGKGLEFTEAEKCFSVKDFTRFRIVLFTC